MTIEDTLRETFETRLDGVDLPVGDVAGARRTGARMRVRRRVGVGAAALGIVVAGVGGSLVRHDDRADGPSGGVGHWQELPAAPLSPRAMPLGVWTGNEVIYLGGEKRPCAPIVSCDVAMTHDQAARAYGYLSDGAAYDLASGTWRRIASAPGYLDSGSEAAFAAGRLYADTSKGWFAYDVRSDRWSAFESPWRDGYGLSPVGDVIYGQTKAGRIMAFNASTARWTTYPVDPIRPRLKGVEVSGAPSGPIVGGYEARKPYDVHHGSPTWVDAWDGHAWHRLPQTGQLQHEFVWTGRRLVDPTVGVQDRGDEYTWPRPVPYGGALDPTTGAWQPLPATLEQAASGWKVMTSGYPAAAGGAGWFVVDGRVYNDNTGQASPLPRPDGAPSDYASGVWADGRLVAFGGVSYSEQKFLGATNHTWVYTP